MSHLKNRELKYYVKLIGYIWHFYCIYQSFSFSIFITVPQFFFLGDFHVFFLDDFNYMASQKREG